jgi:multidrug resistance protein MdtO
MAPPVRNAERVAGNIWLQRLAPFPGRFDFALRLALICALTTLVVEIYQTPSPALTIYLVFFLNKPDRMGSVIANVALIVVISVVIALLIPLVIATIDLPPLRVASMAILSFIMLFLASASRLKPIGATVALIAAYTLDLLGSVQMGELATRGLLYAWLFIAIPAGVSLCVNLLMAPAPRTLVEAEIARRLRIVASLLTGNDAMTRRRLAAALQADNNDLLKLLKMAQLEKSLTRPHAAALTQAAQTSFEMLVLVDIMRAEGLDFPRALAGRLSDTLEEMALCLDRRALPSGVLGPGQDMADNLAPGAAEIFRVFKTAIETFTQTTASSGLSGNHGKQGVAVTKTGFFLPDAFSNPDHIRHALKTTAAAMICYFLFQLLDWPGIHTALITCYIVSLGTTAETVEKLGLRIAGCLIGALAGVATMLFLIPAVTSIGGLMIIVFLGAFPAAWIAVGSPRIAYAGFQIVFAFLLCVVQGSSPDFDLTVARDRVIGILLGNVATYLVFANVWPVSVADRIDHVAARLLRELAAMLDRGGSPARLTLVAQARATLSMLARDLDLVAYEPTHIRPADNWIDARRRGLTDLVSLYHATLMLGAVETTDFGSVASDLNALADGLMSDAASCKALTTSIDPVNGARIESYFLHPAKKLIGRIRNDFQPEHPGSAQVRDARV